MFLIIILFLLFSNVVKSKDVSFNENNITKDFVFSNSEHDSLNYSWTKLNGPYGGIIRRIKSKGDTLAAVAGSSIFYSLNRGESWIHAKFKTTDNIGDIIFSSYGSLVIACGNAGLYETFDFINFRKIPIRNLFYEWRISTLGKDNKGGIYFTTVHNNRIFYSKDSCKTWRVDSNIPNSGVENIVCDDSNNVYAGSWNKILIKRNNVTSWEEVIFPQKDQYIFILAVDKKYVFAASRSHKGFFKSSDQGRTWKETDSHHMINLSLNSINSVNGTVLLAGTRDYFLPGYGVMISKNKGEYWRTSNEGLIIYPEGGSLEVNKNDIFLGLIGGGLYKSNNGGEHWKPHMKNLSGAYVTDFIIDNNQDIIATSWGEGIQISNDDGTSWKTINKGLKYSKIFNIIRDVNGYLYAHGEFEKTNDNGLLESTDNGLSWHMVEGFNTLVYYWKGYEITGLFKDYRNRIYVTHREGIIRLSEDRKVLEHLNNGLIKLWMNSMVFDKSGEIFAGGFDGIIYKSVDDGKSWKLVKRSNNHVFSAVNEIVIDSNGYIYAANDDEGVLKSTDKGSSWQYINNGLEDYNARGIVVDKFGNLLTFNKFGLFYSTDEGENWKKINGSLDANLIQVDEFNNIYAATGEGMYKGKFIPNPLTSVNENEVILDFSLSQNYPNPFNPSTIIKFSIKNESMTILKVFNSLGEEVKTLINESKLPGIYEMTFDGSELSSGVYFYTLISGEMKVSKKMILMK